MRRFLEYYQIDDNSISKKFGDVYVNEQKYLGVSDAQTSSVSFENNSSKVQK